MTAPAAPRSVRRLDTPSAGELAGLAAVFEDLQYALRCCEQLVSQLGRRGPDAVLVEALWTGALLAYVRCFSPRSAVLKTADLDELENGAEFRRMHDVLLQLRDHLASRHVNPREAFTIGAAQANDGTPTGIAVVSSPRPLVDESTVRMLGRLAYLLAGRVDARMQERQREVLGEAAALSPAQLAALPLVHLTGSS
ncbi:hypothetical protein FHX44_111587 [Pseudonocardia hierapolitana]|uniref:Uncharacterized protein n=1 Tax=Pseudonocardia hierapolitana TaxID=1128676 RepID=A0A561SLH2_9PSEU|nr:hypothetical protein [Pseudonocardia hierapolitana]TWF75703.1 hypothetical protein FHX44_111587 [Pseudonocardia hierapolitana]